MSTACVLRLLCWFASAVGLIFIRQFFHEVRWSSRIPWGAFALACMGIVAFAVVHLPEPYKLLTPFRIVTVASLFSMGWFIWRYSRMERWWRHSIGKTIVIKDTVIIILLALFGAGLVGYMISPWVSFVFLVMLPPIMFWRTEVWQRIHDQRQQDKGKDEAPV